MGYGPLVLGRQLGRRIARRKLCAISILFLITFVLPIFLYTLLAYVIAGDPRLVPHAIRNARNVLLITAHPDDECLFFSPSLLQSWGKPHVNRHLLVLSSGRLRENPKYASTFVIMRSNSIGGK
jgi:N-acetylglucosaminylphosphatidylinositol deacetylase